MSYTSYQNAETRITNRETFSGNSMRGDWNYSDTEYVVYSYRTPIAYIRYNQAFLNVRKFSTTTSRQQNIVRRAVVAMGLPVVEYTDYNQIVGL